MIYSIINVIISLNFLLIYNSFDLLYKKADINETVTLKNSNDDYEQFSVNKDIPEPIRMITLEALSYFPELVNVKIDFQFKKNISGSVMQAQPKVGSLLFKKKEHRAYKIKISRYLVLEDDIVPIESLPKDVLLGWIGHELGHIQDYLDRSAMNLLGFGIKYYCSKNFLTEAEISADSYAVAHGLGDKIIATKNFVLNHDKLPEAYKNKIKALYMSPGEILSMVDAEEKVVGEGKEDEEVEKKEEIKSEK